MLVNKAKENTETKGNTRERRTELIGPFKVHRPLARLFPKDKAGQGCGLGLLLFLFLTKENKGKEKYSLIKKPPVFTLQPHLWSLSDTCLDIHKILVMSGSSILPI